MKNRTKIEFKFKGVVNGVEITPDTLDISDLQDYLADISSFILADKKKNQRSKNHREPITINYEEGSTKIIAFISMLWAAPIGNDLNSIQDKNLEQSNPKRVEIVQKWQQKCLENETFSIDLTLGDNEFSLHIDNNTDFLLENSVEFQEEEVYLYGKVTEIGGKTNTNIHLDTEEYGLIRIDTERSFIEQDDINRVYKMACIRAKVYRSIYTGELRERKATFIELIKHNPKLDTDKLNNFIKEATPTLKELPKDWVRQIRGPL